MAENTVSVRAVVPPGTHPAVKLAVEKWADALQASFDAFAEGDLSSGDASVLFDVVVYTPAAFFKRVADGEEQRDVVARRFEEALGDKPIAPDDPRYHRLTLSKGRA